MIYFSSSVTQNEMFRVFHAILRCTDTRVAALDYLEQLLSSNSKRAMMQAERHLSATDGFLLNFLYIMQHLNGKVKLNSVSGIILSL